MTSTVARPSRPADTGRRPPARPAEPLGALTAGGRAGTAAALLGLLTLALPVLAVWWGEDRSGTDALDAVRSAAHLWLVAHGVVLEVPTGRYGLAPLGLALLPAWLCWRAGRAAAREAAAGSPREALQAAAGVALLYGGVGVVVAAAASGSGPAPVLWTALTGPPLLALVAAGAGALRAVPDGPLPRLPQRVGGVLRTGTGALLLLLGASALLVAVSLGLDGGAAADVAQATEPGAVGGLGLAAIGISLAPNAVVWAASWLAGPGFAVGAGTSVSPFAVELGPVPALPLLVALPDAAPPSALAVLAVLVPVLAGGLAGWGLAAPVGLPWTRWLPDAVAAGVLAGGLLGVLAVLSGGPLGGERLAVVGPSAWQTAAAAAVLVTVGTATSSAVRVRRG